MSEFGDTEVPAAGTPGRSVEDELVASLFAKPAAPTAPPPKKSSWVRWLAIGAVVVLVLLIVLNLALSGAEPVAPGTTYACKAGACAADPAGTYATKEACDKVCASPCNALGTASVAADGTCVCKPGVEGDRCERCPEGRGPAFPCCDMFPLQWKNLEDPARAELNPECWGELYGPGGESEGRRCVGNSTYCQVTPTATDYHNVGVSNRRAHCSLWIDTDNGKAVSYSPNSTWGSYLTRLREGIESGQLRPGIVWCRTQPVRDVNNDVFNSECVAENAFSCDVDTGRVAAVNWTEANLQAL